MTHLTSPLHSGEPLGPEEKPEVKKRTTRHYAAELAALENRVQTARLLLEKVKVEKGSAEVLSAVLGLLKGE